MTSDVFGFPGHMHTIPTTCLICQAARQLFVYVQSAEPLPRSLLAGSILESHADTKGERLSRESGYRTTKGGAERWPHAPLTVPFRSHRASATRRIPMSIGTPQTLGRRSLRFVLFTDPQGLGVALGCYEAEAW